MKGKRLGERLFDKIVRYGRSGGTERSIALVRADNVRMLGLARKFGFQMERSPDVAEVKNHLFIVPPSLTGSLGAQ